jgi:hypothetical protein
MPAPFQRKSIAVGPRAEQQRRVWQWIPPSALAEGDVVPGMGLVHRVREVVVAPGYESGMAPRDIAEAILWAVRIDAGVPDSQEYEVDASQNIWAFACEREGTSASG